MANSYVINKSYSNYFYILHSDENYIFVIKEVSRYIQAPAYTGCMQIEAYSGYDFKYYPIIIDRNCRQKMFKNHLIDNRVICDCKTIKEFCYSNASKYDFTYEAANLELRRMYKNLVFGDKWV